MLANQRWLANGSQPFHRHQAVGSARSRSGWWIAACAVLFTTIGFAQSSAPSSGGEVKARAESRDQAPVTLNGQQTRGEHGLPAAVYANMSAAIGKDQAPYHAVPRPGGFSLRNPNDAVSADFTSTGVSFHHGVNRWGLALRHYGYGDRLRTAGASAPRANDNRVEYHRDGLTEWYVNGPMGLEQGFTIERAPGRADGEPLTLALDLSGNLTASVDPGGSGLTLSRDGAAALRYASLSALDADRRELRAWLEVDANTLRVRVDDTNARYPLIIDPYIQASRLTTALVYPCPVYPCDDGKSFDRFGQSVSISADSSTIVVGVPYFRSGTAYTGAAYVFENPGGNPIGWHVVYSYAARLFASDNATTQLLVGWSTAISSNGDTIVLGAPGWVGGPNGAAYVFVKPANNGWWGITGNHTEIAKLRPRTTSDRIFNGSFGLSIAMSGDGRTIAVGVPRYEQLMKNYDGAAYLYYKPSTGWVTATETTWVIGGGPYSSYGSAVALNADGSVLVVGAPRYNVDNEGVAFAYLRVPSNPGFPDQFTTGARLEGSDTAAGDRFGSSVATNATGDVFVVGAPGTSSSTNTQPGAAYVFAKPEGGWPQFGILNEIAKLTASDGLLTDGLGTSVAINGDGNQIVAGAPQSLDVSGQGAVYVFAKSPARAWTSRSESAKVTSNDLWYGDRLGLSTSISGNASAIVAGAPYKNIDGAPQKGAAYIFTGSVTPPRANTSTAIVSASPDPVLVGQPMTVSYSVSAQPGDPLAPSGTVTVQASTGEGCTGNAPAGFCTLAFGTAIDRNITATYSGDADFNPSTSPGVVARVTDFSVAVSPSSQTIVGRKATFTLTVDAVNGFSGTVSLSCAGGPAGSTCNVSPSSVTLAGATTTTAKATVTVPTGTVPGNYPVTFTAGSGGATRSTTATVVRSGAGRDGAGSN
jgi:trimeric autotransporter adhesin